MTPFIVLAKREVALAWGGGGPFLAVGFFAAVTIMLPLGLGAAPAQLSGVAPGVAWIALVLASLLSLDRMFERDLESGALDLLALSGPPLEVISLIKCGAQWLVCAAPLAIAAPLGVLALGGPLSACPMTVVVALIGGAAFAFAGGAGAALALASRRGGVLIALIVLPLLTPPVIFGGAAIERAASGGSWSASVALLCAYSLAAIALSPFAMAGACRNALS